MARITEEQFAAANRIATKLQDYRKKAGYRTKKALAEHLNTEWGLAPDTAYDYVRELEGGYKFTNLTSQNLVPLIKKRVTDYLVAVKVSVEDAKDLLREIRTIRPDFEYGPPMPTLHEEQSEDVFKRIVSAYDQEVLIPEVGEGNLRNRLLTGLEKIMYGEPVTMDLKSLLSEGVSESVLDREIDYNAIPRGHNQRVRGRLSNAFSNANIHTYRDLVEYVCRGTFNKAPRKYKREDWFDKKGKNMRKARDALCINTIGYCSLSALYLHLNNIGIKLFEEGYTLEELGKGIVPKISE